jgi:hypothetical protein
MISCHFITSEILCQAALAASSPAIGSSNAATRYAIETTCPLGSLSGLPLTQSNLTTFPSIPHSSFNSLITATSGSSPESTNPPGNANMPFQGSFPLVIKRTSSPLIATASTAKEG